jgi:serine/threonine-protein kinase HipA
MRKALIFVKGTRAGILTEFKQGREYEFEYPDNYSGPEISLTMPANVKSYKFDEFPPFFDGLLPEGIQLEGLLKINKIDRNDLLSQLIAVGGDLIGVVTVREMQE